MKRIIDFDVSIGGQESIVVRVEYESSFSSFEEIKKLPYSETRKVFTEAVDALRKEIGHNDFEYIYWQWIV